MTMTRLWDGSSRRVLAALLSVLLLAPGLTACTTAMPATGEAMGPTTSEPPADAWPRELTSGDNTFSIFQPQYDRWEQGRLDGRSAVAVESQASPEPRYGVIWFTARTQVDKETRMVTLEDRTISKADFPTVPDGGAGYLAALQRSLSDAPLTIALDRLQAELEIEQAENPGGVVAVRNDPPRIIVSQAPALLLRIDGQSALRSVAGTSLLRVINTRVLLLLDQSAGRYYLWLRNQWLAAPKLDGPWAVASDPPASVEAAKQVAVQGGTGGSPRPRDPRSRPAAPSRIHADPLREHHAGRAPRAEGPADLCAGGPHRHPGRDEHRRRSLPVYAGAGVLRAALGPLVPRQDPAGALGVRERRPAPSRLRPHPGEPLQGRGARGRSRHAAGAGGRDRRRHPADGHDQPA